MTCTTVTTLQAAADWAEACMWLRILFTVAGAHPALARRLDTQRGVAAGRAAGELRAKHKNESYSLLASLTVIKIIGGLALSKIICSSRTT
jgi:hypothetical protein